MLKNIAVNQKADALPCIPDRSTPGEEVCREDLIEAVEDWVTIRLAGWPDIHALVCHTIVVSHEPIAVV